MFRWKFPIIIINQSHESWHSRTWSSQLTMIVYAMNCIVVWHFVILYVVFQILLWVICFDWLNGWTLKPFILWLPYKQYGEALCCSLGCIQMYASLRVCIHAILSTRRWRLPLFSIRFGIYWTIQCNIFWEKHINILDWVMVVWISFSLWNHLLGNHI